MTPPTAIQAMDRDAARALEVDSRRPLSQASHPDLCDRLTLHGVAWAIPAPRQAIVPRFEPDGVSLAVRGGPPPPEARYLLTAARLRENETCPRCGRPTSVSLLLDAQRDAEMIRAAFQLAATLLDAQYALTDDQKAALLAFEASRPPSWLAQLLEWSAQCTTNAQANCPPAPPTPSSLHEPS